MPGKHDANYLKLMDASQRFVDRNAARIPLQGVPPFACPTYPHKSAASLPTCSESCPICADQYLPQKYLDKPQLRGMMTMHSDVEAGLHTKQLLTSAREDIKYVQDKLERYGDAIMKRWQRRTVTRRAALVRQAMPDMYERNFAPARLHYDHIRAVSGAMAGAASKAEAAIRSPKINQVINDYQKQAYNQHLLPYLNVATLAEDPANLLAILQYRAYVQPSDWVPFDADQLRIPFHCFFAEPAYNPHCVVMHGDQYGTLIPWSLDAAHRGDIVGYSRAALILESQKLLAHFLREMVDQILSTGIDGAPEGREQLDTLAQKDSYKADSILGQLRRREGYRATPRYDIDEIIRCLRGRYRVLLDELWSVQTGPVYLQKFLQRIRNTERHDRYTSEDQQQVLVSYTIGLYLTCDTWRMAVNQALFVRQIQKSRGDQVRAGEPLPAEYDCALTLLEGHLKSLYESQLSDLSRLIAHTTTYQDQLTFRADGSAWLEMTREKMFSSQPLLWNTSELQDKYHFSMRPTFYLSFIDRIIADSSPAEKSGIDELLLMHFANMTTVADVLAAIRYHRPCPNVEANPKMVALLTRLQPGGIPAVYQTGFTHRLRNTDRLWPHLKTLLDLGAPPTRASQASLTHLDELHTACGAFWDDFRKTCLESASERGYDGAENSHAMILCSAIQTKSFSKLRQEQRVAIEKLIKERNAKAAASDQYADAIGMTTASQTVWGTEYPAEPSLPKAKVKTRPANRSDSPQSTDDQIEEAFAGLQLDSNAGGVVVSTESRDLFERMFTSYTKAEGSVDWQDFVAAMVDAGCAVIPNGGSAVTFTDKKHSIVFHRPHPDPTIDPIMLRSMGKRLRKWFGWDAGTFCRAKLGCGATWDHVDRG